MLLVVVWPAPAGSFSGAAARYKKCFYKQAQTENFPSGCGLRSGEEQTLKLEACLEKCRAFQNRKPTEFAFCGRY